VSNIDNIPKLTSNRFKLSRKASKDPLRFLADFEEINLDNITIKFQENKTFKRIKTIAKLIVIPFTLYKKYTQNSDFRLLRELVEETEEKKFNPNDFRPDGSNYQDIAEIAEDFREFLDNDDDND